MTVTYPIVSPEENDLLDPQWGADISESANDHQDRVTELEAGTYIGEDVEATTAASSSGAETFSAATVTWTADSASRYRVQVEGTHASTVSGDVARLRIRYKAGSSVDSAGTQMRIITVRAEAANSGAAFCLMATVTGISGQHTAGVSVQRVIGTGSYTINSNSTDECHLIVERIAFG